MVSGGFGVERKCGGSKWELGHNKSYQVWHRKGVIRRAGDVDDGERRQPLGSTRRSSIRAAKAALTVVGLHHLSGTELRPFARATLRRSDGLRHARRDTLSDRVGSWRRRPLPFLAMAQSQPAIS